MSFALAWQYSHWMTWFSREFLFSFFMEEPSYFSDKCLSSGCQHWWGGEVSYSVLRSSTDPPFSTPSIQLWVWSLAKTPLGRVSAALGAVHTTWILGHDLFPLSLFSQHHLFCFPETYWNLFSNWLVSYCMCCYVRIHFSPFPTS